MKQWFWELGQLYVDLTMNVRVISVSPCPLSLQPNSPWLSMPLTIPWYFGAVDVQETRSRTESVNFYILGIAFSHVLRNIYRKLT
jgi:hypothetical protein